MRFYWGVVIAMLSIASMTAAGAIANVPLGFTLFGAIVSGAGFLLWLIVLAYCTGYDRGRRS